MGKKALQVNVDYDIPIEEFKAAMLMAAEPVAQQPGLIWKVWTYDDANKHAGGWYLFESLEAAQAYLDSPVVAAQKSHPAMSNFSTKLFDIGEEASAITRAPIDQKAPA